jgi:hypothetical protein
MEKVLGPGMGKCGFTEFRFHTLLNPFRFHRKKVKALSSVAESFNKRFYV